MIVWQDPPPYIQYIEEAEALGRAAYLGGACAGLGVLIRDQEAVADAIDDFSRRTVLAGTDGPLVDAAFQSGIDREKAAVALMLDLGPDDGSARRQRREEQVTEYFVNGCSDLVINYPGVFRLAPDAPEAAPE